MTSNPLGEPQREIKGAETFSKYEYQYHWALARLLDEHKTSADYAIFVEYHEDVVVSNSLNKDVAEFDFTQIKANDSSAYSIANIIYAAEGSSSILEKLLTSATTRSFKDKIVKINLVASHGFKPELQAEGISLEVITKADLSETASEKFTEHVKTKLGMAELPTTLSFVIPKFQSKGCQEYVIGRIAELLASLYPHSHCDAPAIYRLLIDELHRKGGVTFDYLDWDAAIAHKSVTYASVHSAIAKHSTIKGLDAALAAFEGFANDMGIQAVDRQELRGFFKRHYYEKISLTNTLNVKFSSEVHNLRKSVPGLGTSQTIQAIVDGLPPVLIEGFNSETDLMAAVICELVTE